MALLIRGKTLCPICRLPIGEEDDIVLFPAFVDNELDPFYMFSDAAFHARCFHEHPYSEQALERLSSVENARRPDQRICLVCDQQVTDPADYIGWGFLTDDPAEPASNYNFVHLHQTHVCFWGARRRVLAAIGELDSSGKWRGDALSRISKMLSCESAEE